MQNRDKHSYPVQLHDGASFYCEHCHARSILREKKEYDGFTVKRTYYCCAFCQAEITDISNRSDRKIESSDISEAPSKSSLDAFDALFSSEEASSGSAECESSGGSALDDLFGGGISEESSSSLDSLFSAAPSPAPAAENHSALSQYHFCKNCIHHFQNPFRVHCVLHNRDVEPLDDCPDFAALSSCPQPHSSKDS